MKVKICMGVVLVFLTPLYARARIEMHRAQYEQNEGWLLKQFEKKQIWINQKVEMEFSSLASVELTCRRSFKSIWPTLSLEQKADLQEQYPGLVDGVDTNSAPVISLVFTDEGAKELEEITTKYLGQRWAIMMNGTVLATPISYEPIRDGRVWLGCNTSSRAELEVIYTKINEDLKSGKADDPKIKGSPISPASGGSPDF